MGNSIFGLQRPHRSVRNRLKKETTQLGCVGMGSRTRTQRIYWKTATRKQRTPTHECQNRTIHNSVAYVLPMIYSAIRALLSRRKYLYPATVTAEAASPVVPAQYIKQRWFFFKVLQGSSAPLINRRDFCPLNYPTTSPQKSLSLRLETSVRQSP